MLEDPVFAAKVAMLEIEIMALEVTVLKVISEDSKRRGPGPEVFFGNTAADGPFTVKVQFFSGRPRDVNGKVRILRFGGGTLRDETFRFTVRKPKDVAEIGVFSVESP